MPAERSAALRRGGGRRARGRYWSSSLISGSASARAAMQRRMSPTGGIPSSSRRTPLDPPSSATATTTVRLLVCSLRPRSKVDRPSTPPIATIRGPRARKALLVDELDERLVGRPERGGQRPGDAVRPKMARTTPARRAISPRSWNGELERHEVHVVSAMPPGWRSLVAWRMRWATRRARAARGRRTRPAASA